MLVVADAMPARWSGTVLSATAVKELTLNPKPMPISAAGRRNGASEVLVIDSVVGRGTRVELALPFADQAPEQAAEASGAVPVAGRRARVLIVDDDPQVRHVTASFLTAFGHSTTEAGDGEAALRLLQDGRYDIVVADLAMPGMSGIDLAAEIRDRDPGLPVLILTGHAEAMQIPDDLPVLTKPFRSADLAARVATLLDGGAGPAT